MWPNYIATGDSGMGMTHGTIAGMLITDLIQGRDNHWAKLYEPSRKTLGALGEWARENLTYCCPTLHHRPVARCAPRLPGDDPLDLTTSNSRLAHLANARYLLNAPITAVFPTQPAPASAASISARAALEVYFMRTGSRDFASVLKSRSRLAAHH